MENHLTLNYERIYEYRFKGISPETKDRAWSEVAPFVCKLMGNPTRLLDPAAGRLEFLRFAPAGEKWAIDLQAPGVDYNPAEIQFHRVNVFEAKLPKNHFEGAFVSNFLEHLASPEEIHRLLVILHDSLKSGGTVAILGPNFKYCSKVYYDCADHRLALTHISVSEMLYAAGFELRRVVPRFLPFSFRGRLPVSSFLVRLYLRLSFFWPWFGKQFLVIGEKR